VLNSLERTKEIKDFKQPATMDEILEAKLAPVIDAINGHVQTIYKDFNMALHKQHNNLIVVEKDISKMVQVLWGIVNKTNARAAALERLLIKNGLPEEDLANEILAVEEELEKTGQWENVNMDAVAKEIGLQINSQTDQASV
jgi:hypothetical protein